MKYVTRITRKHRVVLDYNTVIMDTTEHKRMRVT